MKSYILSILSFWFIFCSIFAQDDITSVSILDKFSKQALEARSVNMTFNLTVNDAIEGTETSSEGEIVIKGDKYRLDLPDNIVWFDGEAIYTLVPEVEEVTITEPDPEDEAFLSAPSLLFTMYREGYKIRLVGESADGSIIDLYPEDMEADFSRIRLHISNDYKLLGAEYRRKDGITMDLSITSYFLGRVYKESYFKFDRSSNKNVDIIDMRF